jgi:hypothetical protein
MARMPGGDVGALLIYLSLPLTPQRLRPELRRSVRSSSIHLIPSHHTSIQHLQLSLRRLPTMAGQKMLEVLVVPTSQLFLVPRLDQPNVGLW